MQRGLPERRKIKDVAKVVAVSSAKGGVGKSTVAGESTSPFTHLATQAYPLPNLFRLTNPILRESESLSSLRAHGIPRRDTRHRHLRALYTYSVRPLRGAAVII